MAPTSTVTSIASGSADTPTYVDILKWLSLTVLLLALLAGLGYFIIWVSRVVKKVNKTRPLLLPGYIASKEPIRFNRFVKLMKRVFVCGLRKEQIDAAEMTNEREKDVLDLEAGADRPVSVAWALPHLLQFRAVDDYATPVPIVTMLSTAQPVTVTLPGTSSHPTSVAGWDLSKCSLEEQDSMEEISTVEGPSTSTLALDIIVEEEEAEGDITDPGDHHMPESCSSFSVCSRDSLGDIIDQFPLPPSLPTMLVPPIVTGVPPIVLFECKESVVNNVTVDEPSILPVQSQGPITFLQVPVPKDVDVSPVESSVTVPEGLSNVTGQKFSLSVPPPRRGAKPARATFTLKVNQEGYKAIAIAPASRIKKGNKENMGFDFDCRGLDSISE